MTSVRGGTLMPSGTVALAATMLCVPTLAPGRTVAPMAIRLASPIVAPKTRALWPSETRAPMRAGWPGVPSTRQLSCTLARGPISTGAASPRRIAPNQTLDSRARRTSPMSCALGATARPSWHRA